MKYAVFSIFEICTFVIKLIVTGKIQKLVEKT